MVDLSLCRSRRRRYGTVIGSQFFKEGYTDDVNDIDLFRFGAITEALNLNSGKGKEYANKQRIGTKMV